MYYPCITLKGIFGYVDADYIIRQVLRNFFPRCLMSWYIYIRIYWLRSLSPYPICCTDFGTISLLYLGKNIFVLLFYIYINKINISTRLHFISDFPSCFNDCTDKAIENTFLCLTLLIEDGVVSYIFERRLSRDHLSYICPIDFRED